MTSIFDLLLAPCEFQAGLGFEELKKDGSAIEGLAARRAFQGEVGASFW